MWGETGRRENTVHGVALKMYADSSRNCEYENNANIAAMNQSFIML